MICLSWLWTFILHFLCDWPPKWVRMSVKVCGYILLPCLKNSCGCGTILEFVRPLKTVTSSRDETLKLFGTIRRESGVSDPVAACTYLLLCFVCRCPRVITAALGEKVNKPKGRCSLLAAAVLLHHRTGVLQKPLCRIYVVGSFALTL
jgi:hypothetical protein